MSYFDYPCSQQLTDAPFAALAMAAKRRADSTNLVKLQHTFPETWDELQARYHAPGGLLDDD